ncbi:unnamed protein product [uncultured virus]|nr:unnamed protein product [uncultured virus]
MQVVDDDDELEVEFELDELDSFDCLTLDDDEL